MSMPSPYRRVMKAISQRIAMSEKREFRQLVMEGEWKEVIHKYDEDRDFHKIRVKGKGTALHVAVNIEKGQTVKSLVDAIVKHEGNDNNESSALTMKDESDATPLHLAAYRGFTSMCKFIVGENGERKHLIQEENEKGETPLFWAVLSGRKEVFAYLYHVFKNENDINIAITKNNDSILHHAIRIEKFDLANIILHCYRALKDLRNEDGVTPLEVLATRTSAFESGSNLSWWKRVLYYCTPVDIFDVASYLKRSDMSKGNGNKEKDINQVSIQVAPNPKSSEGLAKEDVTCLQIIHNHIQKLVSSWRCLSQLGMNNSTRNKGVGLIKAIMKIKQKHIWGRQLLNGFMENPYESYMGNDGTDPQHNDEDDEEDNNEDDEEHNTEDDKEEIEKDDEDLSFFEKLKKQEYDFDLTMETSSPKDSAKRYGKEASRSKDSAIVEKEKTFLAVAKSGIVEIMDELHSKVPPSSSHDITADKKGLLLVAMKNIIPKSPDKVDKMETAYLVAAKNGIVEIVSQLQSKIESVVHDTNSKKENVLLVAVKNKQPLVVVELKNKLDVRFENLILGADDRGNTVLHLAAEGTGTYNKKTWQIAGAAMQMMWDIKWYKFIKNMVPEDFNFRSNKDGKTPSEIFKEEHTELLQQSSQWLKDTAESCSVVAALIAGVSFATSSSVPGGTKDETGKPILEGQPAFDAFAISSLVGLYFSVTALIMFLSILTSRKEVEDFRRSLPLKLLFGFSSLFVSIVAMLVSFCAGHFFVLTDKYKGILFPLYVATCFPVTFYAVVQFPLYVDLVKVILKKVPPPSAKGVHI